MASKVGKKSANLPNMFQQQDQKKKEFEESKKRTRVSVPTNKQIFKSFLNKFESEEDQQAAKVKLQQLTQKEKQRSKAQQAKTNNQLVTLPVKRQVFKETNESAKENSATSNDVAKGVIKAAEDKRVASCSANDDHPKPQETHRGSVKIESNKEKYADKENNSKHQETSHVEKMRKNSTSNEKGQEVKAISVQGGEFKEFPRKRSKTKEEMQNYLLSHVLFEDVDDETEQKRKSSIEELFEKVDGDDDECVQELEEYLNLLESEPRHANQTDVKPEEKTSEPTKPMKKGDSLDDLFDELENMQPDESCMEELSEYLTVLESEPRTKKQKAQDQLPKLSLKMVNGIKSSFESPDTSNVGTPNSSNSGTSTPLPKKQLSKDLVSKFSGPEALEQRRQEQEKAKEERRRRQEEYMQKIITEKREEDQKRIRMEKIMEEERKRVEMRNAKAREAKEAKEAKEPQLKTKMVLQRFEGALNDKKKQSLNQNTKKPIGQLKVNPFEEKTNEKSEVRSNFKDPSLSGVRQIVSKMRTQLDTTQETTPMRPPKRLKNNIAVKKGNDASTHDLRAQLNQQREKLGSAEPRQKLLRENSPNELDSVTLKSTKSGTKTDKEKTDENWRKLNCVPNNTNKKDPSISVPKRQQSKKRIIIRRVSSVDESNSPGTPISPPTTMQTPTLAQDSQPTLNDAPEASRSKCPYFHVPQKPQPIAALRGKRINLNPLENCLMKKKGFLPYSVRNKLQTLNPNFPERLMKDFDQAGAFHELKLALHTYFQTPPKSDEEVRFRADIEHQMYMVDSGTMNMIVPKLDPLPAKRPESKPQPTLSSQNNESLVVNKVAGDPSRKFFDKCLTLQKCFNNLSGDDQVKPLAKVKAESEAKTWKWKERQFDDLQEYMKRHEIAMPSSLEARQNKIKQAGQELKDKESSATTLRDVEEIKRLRDAKDKEFNDFINEVKNYVNKTDENSQYNSEAAIGVKNYIALIEKGPQPQGKPSLYDKRPASKKKTPWNFNAMTKNIQQNFEPNGRPVTKTYYNQKTAYQPSEGTSNFLLRRPDDQNRLDAIKNQFKFKQKEALGQVQKNVMGLKPVEFKEQKAKGKVPKHIPHKDAWSYISGLSDQNRKDLNILGKHGFKPSDSMLRPEYENSLSNSEIDDDDDDDIPDPFAPCKTRAKPQRSSPPIEEPSPEEPSGIVRGMCKNVRAMFEQKNNESGARQQAPLRHKPLQRSKSSATLRSKFEPTQHQKTQRMSFHPSNEDGSQNSQDDRSNMSRADKRKFLESVMLGQSSDNDANDQVSTRPAPEKHPAFSKFKEAFETGSTLSLHEDAKSAKDDRPTGVKAELEAIRNYPRLQNLLRINKPKSQISEKKSVPNKLARSRTVTNVPQEKRRTPKSNAIAALKSAFEKEPEEQPNKKPFPGRELKKSGTETSVQQEKVQQSQSQPNKIQNRKWVYDTINKYFDVIKEDEEEDSEAEETSYTIPQRPMPVHQEQDYGNPRPSLSRSSSTNKLRDMVSSIAKSRSNLSISTFKENLGSLLKLKSSASSEHLASPLAKSESLLKMRPVSMNMDPGVNDSDLDLDSDSDSSSSSSDSDEEFDEVVLDTPRYTRVKL